MKNIPMPSRGSDRDDLIIAIRRYRYRQEMRGHAITPAEIDQVLAIYDRYDHDHGMPCNELKGIGLPQSLIDALEAAYDKTQEGRQLYSLRKQLFNSVSLCPICGIDPAVELDHFLPLSAFKTLGIYSRNLVPLCHACNHAKLAGFGVHDQADRLFVHAYFDTLPDAQFIEARVNIRDRGLVVEFGILQGPTLPEHYVARLIHQMNALKLNERYVSEVNSYISGHAAALHLQYRAGGQISVRDFLNLQARFEIRAFYRNHWRPTLLIALARHDSFTNGGFAELLPISEDMLSDVANANQ